MSISNFIDWMKFCKKFEFNKFHILMRKLFLDLKILLLKNRAYIKNMRI